MRIAVWHNLPSGGGKRALYDQVRALRSAGHYVEAWCPPSADQKFFPLSEYLKENVVSLRERGAMPRGPLKRRIYFITDVIQRIAGMTEHCQQCAAAITEIGFDVLLVHPCRFFLTSPIAQYVRIPSLLYLQEPARNFYEALPSFPWAAPDRPFRKFSIRDWIWFLTETMELFGKRLQVREEAKWARKFDQVLVNSLFSRESLVRVYNLDSRVCYLGIDTANFTRSAAPKEPFVIGLGSLSFHKRPVFAVQCIGTIPKEKRPKLVWVGNAGSADEARREAEKLGVEFEVRTLIPDAELKDLLSRAAVMIYASHLEPFGYAPLEANACGTAVVALAEGGIRETMNHPHCGVLIPNLDREAFGRALLSYCSDLSFAAEAGKNARAYVENIWSNDSAAERLEQEIRRTILAKQVP